MPEQRSDDASNTLQAVVRRIRHLLPSFGSGRTVPALPQELVDHIIDCLRKDKETLRNCSLVRRAWLSSSSFHLFSRLCWPPCDHAADICQTFFGEQKLRSCRCALVTDPKNLQELLLFLQSSPRICSSIRDLSIRFAWGEAELPFALRHRVLTTPSELAHLVGILPALRCLRLYEPRFHPDASPFPDSTLSTTRDLDRLVLSGIKEEGRHEHFSSFLSYFRRIHTLELADFRYCPLVCAPVCNANGQMTSVDSLQLHPRSLDGIRGLEQLRQIIDLTSLSSLSLLYDWRIVPESGICALLQNTDNLESITCNNHSKEVIIRHPHPCPTVHRLRFYGSSMFDGRTVTYHDWPGVVQIMGCPLAASVNHYTIDFTILHISQDFRVPDDNEAEAESKAALEFLDWSILDTFTPRLTSLSLNMTVEFAHGRSRTGREWSCSVEELILGLVSRPVRDILTLRVQVLNTFLEGHGAS
ncbi:uncharacterized protein PHACADRAFT_252885 [Phanerochaete carnosa HHB-10118-sp]|uniref:F-box domain-containing protein n=1 Tax=Phanerochaete carnosa (strain HHB-10118-sp) TaxID=650164 RepID=K5V6Z3_PHACS|nr:uncharacterized protein PHACADRAFT_252885 [Phanerochaete carnosa HHB-10118-sp]EKM58506.1 hypothetical protein PHACADRAFT_252885 [Phanerochaete carnosa HHB-10118-sp]